MTTYTHFPTSLNFPHTNYFKFPGGSGVSALGAILGSNLLFEFAASDLNATPVASWASRNATGNTLTAAGTARPAWSASSFNGGPGVTFDGVANDMRCTLAAAVANGARPYVFYVLQEVAIAGTQIIGVLGDALPLSASYTELFTVAGTPNLWENARKASDGSETINASTADTSPHLIETGFPTGGTAALVVDGVGTNGTKTGGAASALTIFELGCENGVFFSNVRFAHIVATKDAIAAGTITSVRNYLRGNNFAGYTGSNYGLP